MLNYFKFPEINFLKIKEKNIFLLISDGFHADRRSISAATQHNHDIVSEDILLFI